MDDLPQSKLAVLLHADVVGSTAMVQADQARAHIGMREAFRQLSDSVEAHSGTTREIRGDALVAEFYRASDAVTAASGFQKDWTERSPDGGDVQIRIGIAMGEVIIADQTVTGEGVIMAQRIEQLAEPGSICLQGAVYETLPGRMKPGFASHGEHALKGFREKTRVFRESTSAEPDGVPGFAATADGSVPKLPDKPSIAVLPFVNLSGDPEQVYFSDGISEDIITALSKISNLTVASRSSTFGYRDGAVDTRTVCREQGVRFVLEGSVRKSANRVRVTAQLTDGSTGHSVWADRYDRDLDDIFAVQDELMREIVVALDVELREGEQLRFWSSGTHSVEAWECVRISAPVILNTRFAELDQAKKRLDRALELDPNYAIAWVMLGWYHQCFVDVAGGFRTPEVVSSSLENMQRCAQKAIELDEYCADAYSVLALYHLEKREYDLAKENADKSVELAPGNAENMIEATAVFNKAGDPRRGMELTQRAMEVCPLYRPGFLRALGTANRFLGNPEAAADIYREAVKRQPELLSGQANLASVLGELGRLEEARSVAQTIRGMYPGFSVDTYMAGLAYKNPDDLKRFRDGLIAAGLPE